MKGCIQASCWDCDYFYIGKTKQRLHDRKTEHFKALKKSCQASAFADHITSTGLNIKWDHFEILATGRSVIHCRWPNTVFARALANAIQPVHMYCIKKTNMESIKGSFYLLNARAI